MEKNTRIQLELPAEKVKALDALVERTGLSTRKDLFNYALTLLEWSLKESEQGMAIVSLDREKEQYKELVMPIFSYAMLHKK